MQPSPPCSSIHPNCKSRPRDLLFSLWRFLCYPSLIDYDSQNGTATCYGLDGRVFKPSWGRDFLDLSRGTTRPTQALQWVPWFFLGGKAAGVRHWPTTSFHRQKRYLYPHLSLLGVQRDKLHRSFFFKYPWFRVSWLYINKIQRDATVRICLFTAKLLYMFRVSMVPIIRSTSNCNCSLWYRSNHVSEQQPSASLA